MNLNNENVNKFLSRYINYVNDISSEYSYTLNIRHLLYLIVPAFIIKYGISYEALILKCFKEVKIYISNSEDKRITASFNRNLVKYGDSYFTEKFIVLNQYKNASLANLIDNIVHEFNHAINSINNEILCDDKYIKVRCGISFLVYDRKSMQFLFKSKDSYLEEVINTLQTEEVVNIINSFNNYKIENIEFNNMLYALKHEIGKEYKSDAYYFQSYICSVLMKNKTFTPTISNLRLKGLVSDVPDLFDDVTCKHGSFNRLCSLLEDVYNLEVKYDKTTLFKKLTVSKLKNKAREVVDIINEYDNKCIYK